jgi:hypothetical protein
MISFATEMGPRVALYDLRGQRRDDVQSYYYSPFATAHVERSWSFWRSSSYGVPTASIHVQIHILWYHYEATDFRAFEAVLAIVHEDVLSKNTKEQQMDRRATPFKPIPIWQVDKLYIHPVDKTDVNCCNEWSRKKAARSHPGRKRMPQWLLCLHESTIRFFEMPLLLEGNGHA